MLFRGRIYGACEYLQERRKEDRDESVRRQEGSWENLQKAAQAPKAGSVEGAGHLNSPSLREGLGLHAAP